MDANAVISSEEVFTKRALNLVQVREVSRVSDIFRYKLLHDYGGWLIDMDVTCLKAFDVETRIFWGHHNLPLVGNIMKAPKEVLMWSCYTKAKSK